jgi:hypothetical protein
MSVTLAENSSPDAALTVTVAGWPFLREPMSDSLRETCILKRLICARVMKLEPLDEPLPPEPVLDPPPSPPATLAPLEPLDPLEPLPDDEPLPVVWPTDPLIDAIVPAIGARSRVSERAFSALRTASSALWTSASAAASEMVLPPPELPPPPEPPLLLPDPLPEPLDGFVCLGVVVVGVVGVACAAVAITPWVTDAALAVLALDDEELDDEDEPDWTSSSVSCAVWRFAWASARSTFAALSSMVARS